MQCEDTFHTENFKRVNANQLPGTQQLTVTNTFNVKAVLPEISVLVYLETYLGTGCNKCRLMLEHTLFKELLCQKCNRRAAGVSDYGAATEF